MKKAILVGILALILICGVSGCPQKIERQNGTGTFPPGERVTDADFAVSECEHLCLKALETKNFSSKCLGDPLSESNWVCDIVHSPRIAEDDLKENQCQSYLNGTSQRFVEFTTNCQFNKLG